MKIIVAGSRSFSNYALLKEILDKLLHKLDKKKITILSGHAEGADRLGEQYAFDNLLKYILYPVSKEDWKKHGHKAGVLRNLEMAKNADAAVVFWNGKSPGSKSMIEIAKRKKLKLKIILF